MADQEQAAPLAEPVPAAAASEQVLAAPKTHGWGKRLAAIPGAVARYIFAPQMPDGEKAPSLFTRLRSVNPFHRIDAFGRKYPMFTIGLVMAAVFVFPASFALGMPAYLAGAQTLATTLGLAAATGAIFSTVLCMGGLVIDALTKSTKTELLPSGQVIKGTATDVRAAKYMQRQFDRVAHKRDFDVKAELTARDREVLRSYQALWSRSKFGQLVSDLVGQATGGKLEVTRVAPAAEIQETAAHSAALAGKLKTLNDASAPSFSDVFNRERAYDDSELAAKKTVEPTVAFGRKLQLVSKLA